MRESMILQLGETGLINITRRGGHIVTETGLEGADIDCINCTMQWICFSSRTIVCYNRHYSI